MIFVDDFFTPAVAYDADWTSWVPWVWAAGWLLICTIVIFASIWARQVARVDAEILPIVIGGAAGLAAVATISTMGRHIPNAGIVYLIYGAVLVVGALVGIFFLLQGDIPSAVIGGVIAVAAIIAIASELLTRFAAVIPISVGLLVLGGIAVFLWIAKPGSRSY